MTVDHDDGDRRAVRLVGALLVTIGLALAWVAGSVYLTPDLSAAVAVLVIAHLSCGAVLLLPLGGPGSARVARWAAAILLTADLVMLLPVLLLWLHVRAFGGGFSLLVGSGTFDPVEFAKAMLVLGVVIVVYATAVVVLRRDALSQR